MNKQTSAAEIWAKIEPELIAAGLATGSLLVQRARMIRAIGRALGNRKPPATGCSPTGASASVGVERPDEVAPQTVELQNLPATGVENNRQATAGAIRGSKGATPVTVIAAVGEAPTFTLPRPRRRRRNGDLSPALQSAVDARLAQLIDQACGGYSGDDSVEYR